MTDATPNPDNAVTSLTAKAGDKVDNYTIMEQIGVGGSAVVFRGTDHVLNRDVAIKQIVVPPGEAGDDIRQQALSESAMHKRVAASEPRLLVQYIDTINDPRGLFLISEYVDGPSLEWMLQQDPKPMHQRQALGIVAASAKALDALHQNGVVHRDLKPSNILMPREGGLKLGDFGLAALVAEQQTMDLGSVRYMAPEVLQGQAATAKSDLYSLGMVAYEMLAGRDKFNDAFRTILRDQRNQSMRWVKWHTNVRAKVAPLDQLVEDIPASLAQLVARMMEKDPARRVGSANELLDAIRSHFAQTGEEQTAPGPHAAMAPPKIDDTSQTAVVPQKSKLPVILAATLVLWLAAIGGFLLWREDQKQQTAEDKIAALVTAIEDADKLIGLQKYEEASSAFIQIKSGDKFADQFDPNNRRYRDDLVDAGVFKADALRAAAEDDYITALAKAQQYQQMMRQWATNQPTTPATSLNLTNAKSLVEEYDSREAFQKLADGIEAMLNEGKLDQAIQEVRRTRNEATDATAAADIRRLDDLEKQYNDLLADKRITDLLAEARRLENSGELDDAIELLEDEREDAGDNADARVIALLETLNRRDLIERKKSEVAKAERDGDPRDLLAALKDLQRVQPTQALDVRIEELEIALLLERAQLALDNARPQEARDVLLDVKERDPNNRRAIEMLATIASAQAMVDTLKEADQLFVDRDYKASIKKYKDALQYGPDTTGRINARIKEATGHIAFANSQEALEAGDVVLAQDRLDEAKKAHGETDAIFTLQTRIDELRDYTALLTDGDAAFARQDFGRAKAKYLEAKKIFDSEAINAKVLDCDFGIWLKQCDRAILQRDWEAAESALNRAEAIKTNDQTRSRREQISSRVQ